MMALKSTLLFLGSVLFFSLAASAQHNTPYSRFGLGTDLSTSFGVSKGFGQLGSAFKHPFNMNYTNPASYSKLKLTTFETSVFFNRANIDVAGDSSHITEDASMDYLSLGFPVTDFWGTSIGLIPFSKVSYDIQNTAVDPEFGESQLIESGEGQLTQFYWGNGFNYKNLSFGFNVALLFGNLEYDQRTVFPDTTQRFNSRRTDDVEYRDFIFNLGAQYTLPLKKKQSITFGMHGRPSLNLFTERIEVWERLRFQNDELSIVDTVKLEEITGNNTKLPLEIGGGAMWQKQNRWRLGIDLKYTGWSEFENQLFEQPLTDNFRAAIGGQITPDPENMESYIQRMQYRLGGYYNTGRLEFGDQRVAQYGMTFGVSFPLRNTTSKVTITGDIGTYEPTSGNLVDENYYKLNISFTLNKKWFTQSKIQ